MVLAVVALTLFFCFGTPAGRAKVITVLAPKLALVAGYQLTVTHVSSPSLTQISAQSLKLAQIAADTQAQNTAIELRTIDVEQPTKAPSTVTPILEASDISITLSDFNISERFLHFAKVSASRLTLENLPKKTIKARSPTRTRPPWQLTVADIQLPNTHIALTATQNIPELATPLSLSGDLVLFKDAPLVANIHLQKSAPFHQQLSGALKLSKEGMLSLIGTYEETQDGRLNQLVRRTAPKAIHANYSFAFDLNTLKPTAQRHIAEPLFHIHSLQTDLLPIPTTLRGRIRFQPALAKVRLDDFQIQTDTAQHKLTGWLSPQDSALELTLNGLPLLAVHDWLPPKTIAGKSAAEHVRGNIHGKANWRAEGATPAEISAQLTFVGKQSLTDALQNQVSAKHQSDIDASPAHHPHSRSHPSPSPKSDFNYLAWLRTLPTTFTMQSNFTYSNQLLMLHETWLQADCLYIKGNGQVDFSKTYRDRHFANMALTIPDLNSACLTQYFPNQPQLSALHGALSTKLDLSAQDSAIQGAWQFDFHGHFKDEPLSLSSKTISTLIPDTLTLDTVTLDTATLDPLKADNLKLGAAHPNQTQKTAPLDNHAITAKQKITLSLGSAAPITFANTLKSPDNGHRVPASWEIILDGNIPKTALSFLPGFESAIQATLNLPQVTDTTSNDRNTHNADKKPELTLTANGTLDTVPFNITSLLRGVPHQFEVNQARLKFYDNNPILLSGKYDMGTLDFTAQMDKFHLPAFELKQRQSTAANFSGLIALQGTVLAPRLQANLDAEIDTQDASKATVGTTPKIIPKQVAKIFIDTENGHYVGDIQLRAADPRPTNSIVDSAQTASTSENTWGTLGFSLPRFPLSVPVQLPQTKPAAVTLWMKLSEAGAWFTSTEEALLGELVADIQIPRIARPEQFTGFIRLNHGSYENRLLKLLAKDIHLYAERNEQDQAIHILGHANDGHRGDYRLRGTLPWPAQPHAQHALTLNLTDIQMGYRNALSGNTTGTLTLAGDRSGFLLDGAIQLQPTLITLDNLNTPTISTLDPSQIRDKHASETPQVNPPSALDVAPPILLDVDINAPQQAYLRGRGLEAELAGKLKLTGTLQAPELKGEFLGIRGDYKIFGRKFVLKESNVQLDGNNVIYQLSAEHTRADVQIQAQISGSQEQLTLAFSATPELPEDEIIAFLLFGKTVDSITPSQAIQLASALQQLRPNNGGGSGFDPLGKTRDLIQVDSLTIESQAEAEGENSTGGVTIGIGKYINDRVYVEFLKDSDDSKSWRTNVEVEIAPSLDLKTNAESGRGFSGLELQWRRDY